jgi:hypothetical protein
MTSILTVLLSFCFAMAVGTLEVRATPLWQFVETSCTSSNGGCGGLGHGGPLPSSLPAVIATFNSPDPAGQFYFCNLNGTALGPCPLDPSNDHAPVEIGDPNFTLSWTGVYYSSYTCRIACEFNIAWADYAPTTIYFIQPSFSANLDIGADGGADGSDSYIAGCGIFAQCSITGYWTVAEASSVKLLGVALGFFALVASQVRRRAS